MNVLALDTSAEACSVALLAAGRVHARYEVAPRRHADLLLPMVQAVLAEAGTGLPTVDLFAFGRGPGAFTGLRIAAGMVQGLASGLQRRVIPVSSLAAMAHKGWRQTGRRRVHAAIDARMGEIYWGSVEVLAEGDVRALGPERVIRPDLLAGQCAAEFGDVAASAAAGTGWPLLEGVLPAALLPGCRDDGLLPDALDVLAIARVMASRGESVEPAMACPVYLRDEVVQVRVAQA
jgi:tRNA threonylcarbamoyladenosine biosynthesis protein TsaB